MAKKEVQNFPMKMTCISVELLLSPKVEDRVSKYRFIAARDGGDPQGKPGTAWTESQIWVYSGPGEYQVGQDYLLLVSTKEA